MTLLLFLLVLLCFLSFFLVRIILCHLDVTFPSCLVLSFHYANPPSLFHASQLLPEINHFPVYDVHLLAFGWLKLAHRFIRLLDAGHSNHLYTTHP